MADCVGLIPQLGECCVQRHPLIERYPMGFGIERGYGHGLNYSCAHCIVRFRGETGSPKGLEVVELVEP